MEQPEYTETPVGLARQPETLQAKGRSGSARAPRKAECIQAAENTTKTAFYKLIKKPNNHTKFS